MIASMDPRVVGVGSLAHPGGNLTGLTIGQPEIVSEKRLQLLKEAMPALVRVAVLWDVNRLTDGGVVVPTMAAAARVFGLRLAVFLVESPRTVANRTVIAELGLKHRLPVMSQFSRIVEAGGFMSYGPDLSELFRRAASYVDKILRGAKPADLPIEQPTKFKLVINLKTAKALGLTIPPPLLQRADEIIQ
jgi:putative ABC transport system substrate-binding protein